MFDLLSSPWSGLSVGDRPPWSNDITDDGTPFEFSVALDGKAAELRMLLESQSLPVTATSSWDAGVALQERLRAAGLVSLDRFRIVEDLFRPPAQTDARFSLWHAAVLTDSGRPLLKAYMNPLIRGKSAAPRLVEDALLRLGLDQAWQFLDERLRQFAIPDIRYIALDLDDAKSARVKVYVGASESANEVESLLRGVANVAPGQATEWLSLLTGRTGPFPTRPILCCFAFTSGHPQATATVHVPIRCYVDDDDQAARRVTSLLEPDAAKRLTRTLAAAANRPLGVGRGLLTYASLRPAADRLRVTVYLAPETYAIAAPRRVVVAATQVYGTDNSFAPRVLENFSDVRAETSDRARFFETHSLFAAMNTVGPNATAGILAQLAWLAMFLRDAMRVSGSHWDDTALAAAAGHINAEFDSIVNQLHKEAVARGLLPGTDAPAPFGHGRDPIRDWAYTEVGRLLSAVDEHARLAAAWAVASLVGVICRRATANLSDDQGGIEDAVGTAVTERSALPSSRPTFGSELPVPVDSSTNVFEAIDAVADATMRLASELESLLRPSSLAESAAFPLDGREQTVRKQR
jgi:hypothetical protein